MSDTITFWLGCNVLRHGDIIHACVEILRKLEVDAKVVGGPDYCCGTTKDSNMVAAAGMAKRTAQNLVDTQRDRVVAWCPSCHVHMSDVISRAHDTTFALSHFTELLYERRDRLAAHLTREVPMRVMVHEHYGFDRSVAVNTMARELLAMVPGVSVAPTTYQVPGYMCAPFAGMPKALQDISAKTLAQARAHDAQALVTIFHQCYREMLGLDSDGHLPVYNFIHLIARSMGIDFEDEYKQWKAAGSNAKQVLGAARVAAVGEALVDRALLPELARRPFRAERAG